MVVYICVVEINDIQVLWGSNLNRFYLGLREREQNPGGGDIAACLCFTICLLYRFHVECASVWKYKRFSLATTMSCTDDRLYSLNKD